MITLNDLKTKFCENHIVEQQYIVMMEKLLNSDDINDQIAFIRFSGSAIPAINSFHFFMSQIINNIDIYFSGDSDDEDDEYGEL